MEINIIHFQLFQADVLGSTVFCRNFCNVALRIKVKRSIRLKLVKQLQVSIMSEIKDICKTFHRKSNYEV